MSLLHDVSLDRLTPARLWARIDPATRRLAAACVYRADCKEQGARIEADAAIAGALRFRAAAVQRLPIDKRADYLVRVVRPSETLATALLRALHLTERRAMLGTFLDALGIAQTDGVIESEEELPPPAAEPLGAAIARLRERYPAADVDLYLASLLAMDPDLWAGLAEVPAG
jgi:hypothetical protein